jgi:hypothetical protein
VDAVFAQMARNQQRPEIASEVRAAQDAQPAPTAVSEVQPVLAAPLPVQTFLGRVYAALTLLVVGPPAFFGLRRAAQTPPPPTRVRLTKSA